MDRHSTTSAILPNTFQGVRDDISEQVWFIWQQAKKPVVTPLLKLAVGVCLVMSIMQNKKTQINTPLHQNIKKCLLRKREREIENGIPVNGRHSGSDEASCKSGLSSCGFPFHGLVWFWEWEICFSAGILGWQCFKDQQLLCEFSLNVAAVLAGVLGFWGAMGFYRFRSWLFRSLDEGAHNGLVTRLMRTPSV